MLVGDQVPVIGSEGTDGVLMQLRIWGWPMKPSATISELLMPSVTIAIRRE